MVHELSRDDQSYYFAWLQSQAYVSFAMTVLGDKKELEPNFISLYFQEYPLSTLSREEKIIYCYREAISIYPRNAEALFGLAVCLAKGAAIDSEDLMGTRLEGQRLKNIKLNDLLAELYRKVLVNDRRNSKAIRNLAFCLQQGAHIFPEDLKRTKFEGAEKVDGQQLVIALYEKVIAMNPNDATAVYCLENVKGAQKKRFPQYASYSQNAKLEESVGPQKRAMSPPRAR